MTKQTKTILTGWILMIPLAVMIVLVLLQNMGALEAHAVPVEQVVEEEAETSETGLFDANSAMPCVDTESFRRWYENYSASSVTVGSEPEATGPIIYRIAGEEIDPELQKALYEALDAEGIAYWYEGALAQMFQESHGKVYAENRNGLDKGLFQYRITYWDWEDGDIFDPDAQMRRYAAEMSTRFNMGLSTEEAISRHMTSDYSAAVNWQYVSDVKQWLSQMEAIR